MSPERNKRETTTNTGSPKPTQGTTEDLEEDRKVNSTSPLNEQVIGPKP